MKRGKKDDSCCLLKPVIYFFFGCFWDFQTLFFRLTRSQEPWVSCCTTTQGTQKVNRVCRPRSCLLRSLGLSSYLWLFFWVFWFFFVFCFWSWFRTREVSFLVLSSLNCSVLQLWYHFYTGVRVGTAVSGSSLGVEGLSSLHGV